MDNTKIRERLFKSILFYLLLISQIVIGLFREKITTNLDQIPPLYFSDKEKSILQSFFLQLEQRIPVFLNNFGILSLAPFFLSIVLGCLSLHFNWSLKTFSKNFVIIVLIYYLISTFLIYSFTAYPYFVRVWHDFTDIYYSPLLLIFLFFIFKIMQGRQTN